MPSPVANRDSPGATIRAAEIRDAGAIAHIYNHYVLNTVVTFEEEAVSADEMATRIRETLAIPLPWLVAEQNGGAIGYAYASKWKGRCAYRFSVEGTVYLIDGAGGHGLGSLLYGALIDRLREMRMHSVLGGIALPNEASVKLHERLGFEKVAHLKEVGRKFDRWVDVGYWQLIL
ncbi:arsinothricin resistance N-acetyltransferase ArsN1 family B [Dokdonella soli]|uniref:GNAT family N-acetyltransferase n=1 Tax=Dokdonella soli TaxID=529810 RepID=A0ABN1IWP4_9GAMM